MSGRNPVNASPEALLFTLGGRGVLEVTGADALRWLDGMISNDVRSLAAAGPGSGCYALLLTPQGRIVTDLHVLYGAKSIWLEMEASRLAPARARLERFIVADDVRLTDRSAEWRRLALEGPRARDVLAAAVEPAVVPELAPDSWCAVTIGAAPVRVCAWGFTSPDGFQLFADSEHLDGVVRALRRAGEPWGCVEGDASLFERMRIEAGIPWPDRELDETVLPAEVRLQRAISTRKGCYTGQEVVERMRSRERVQQLLVGLQAQGEPRAEVGDRLEAAGRSVGELTSMVSSPRFGWIALGFVQRDLAEPGTELEARGGRWRVVALPFAAGEGASR